MTKEPQAALIVADDAELRASIGRLMSEAGFAVTEASDRRSTLSAIEASPPAVVVLEWLLGDQDGIEVLMAVRKHPRGGDLPVVMLDSDHPFRDLATEALGLRVAATAKKPIAEEALLAAVDRALGRSQPRPGGAPAAPPEAGRAPVPPPAAGPPADAAPEPRPLAPPEPQPLTPPEPRPLRPPAGGPFSPPPAQPRPSAEGPTAPPARPSPTPRPRQKPGEGGWPPRVEVGRSEMPSSGSLADYPIGEILRAAHARGTSGVLTVRSSRWAQQVFFKDGRPVGATSTVPGQSLADHLREKGKIDEATRASLEAKGVRDTLAQATELVTRGALPGNEMPYALGSYGASVIVSLFAAAEGEMTFVSEGGWEGRLPPVSLDPARLVLDGAATLEGEEALGIPLAMPEPVWAYPRRDGVFPLDGLPLATREARVLAMVRQLKPLAEMLEAGPGGRIEVARVLHGLYLLGCIGFQVGGVRPERPSPRPTPPPPKAARKPAPSAEERLAADIETLAGADFFTVLGLVRGAPGAEAHEAFRAREARYRPEALEALSEELQAKGEELHHRLVEAYRVLTSPARRTEYMDDLEAGRVEAWEKAVEARVDRARQAAEERVRALEEARKATSDKAERKVKAEAASKEASKAAGQLAAAIRAAEESIAAGHPRAAVRDLRELQRSAPEEPMIMAWLGWALFNVDRDKYGSEALTLLETAVRGRPAPHSPYLFLARVAAHVGSDDLAVEMYEAAKQRAPEDQEVAREAHVNEIRAKKRPKRRGLLGKPRHTPSPASPAPSRPSQPPTPRKTPTPEAKPTPDSAWTTDIGTLMKGLFGGKKRS